MTYHEFAHWLNGFFEIEQTNHILPKQVDMIKKRLQSVITENNNKTTTDKSVTAVEHQDTQGEFTDMLEPIEDDVKLLLRLEREGKLSSETADQLWSCYGEKKPNTHRFVANMCLHALDQD